MKNNILNDLDENLKFNKKKLRSFITRQEQVLNETHASVVQEAERHAWEQVDCLSCANCCKKMSPTYTKEDIERISEHLNMSPARFKKKWLYFDKKERDWMNTSQPCQFLDLSTNKCNIYEVRPADCAGFPHFTKMPFEDYFYIHKQNIEYCPATYAMIVKMQELLQKKPEFAIIEDGQ